MTTRQFFLSTWSANPAVLAIALLALILYVKRVGFVSRWRGASFLAGVLLFVLSLVSPLDQLADGYLFSAHMLQHLLLLLVVPPLLLMGIPLRSAGRMSGGVWKGILLHPLTTWFMGVGAMWLWHYPALCNASTTNLWVHRFQYVTLLVMGTMFWLPVLGRQLQARVQPLIGIAYLFTACLACTVMGAFLTFSPITVCSVYSHPVDRLGILSLIREGWRFTPSLDQQLGGLLMWVPACTIYLSFILGLLIRWFRHPQTIPAAIPADSQSVTH